MIVTNDEAVANRVRIMRNPGQERENPHVLPPFNRRLDSIQAAVLRVKLRYLNQWNELRRSAAESYDNLLENNSLVPPSAPSDREHVYHQYVVRSPKRNWLMDQLNEEGVDAKVYYPRPIHRQSFYAYKGLDWGEFPIAEQASREVPSLPMHPAISIWQLSYVASNVNAISHGTKLLDEVKESKYSALETSNGSPQGQLESLPPTRLTNPQTYGNKPDHSQPTV